MWVKKGLIYLPNQKYNWNQSHAQVPVVDVLNKNTWRIYYSTRNNGNQSSTSFIEVEADNPKNILYEHDDPILQFGSLGAFDDSGIMPSCIINVGEKKYLYYIGWTTRQTVPYQNAIGLAISEDGGKTFYKTSEGPIISINYLEPYFSGTSYVMYDNHIFKMWYLSCVKWDIVDGKPEPMYNIKYAESVDGISWKQTGKVAIALKENEGGLVSASVIKQDHVYSMWFAKRKRSDYRINIANSYRIGYAESLDGINWIRKDEAAGIDISENGWDSEMISYPYIFKNNFQLIMMYNGNGFGKTGFGYATWK
jgi:hypothetical protein